MEPVYIRYCGIKVIIFDLDGTLINTMHYFGEVASNVINKYYGIPKHKAKEMYFETSGVPFFQQLEILFPGDERNKKAADEYERKKLSFFFNEPFPDKLREFLKDAKRKYPDFIFAVSSNNFENLVKEYLIKYNVNIFFDDILGYRDNFAKGKDHFKYIMKKYKVDSNEILFVGDSWWDAKIALENGVKFIAITKTFPKRVWKIRYPDVLVIENFEELFNVLEVIKKCKQ